MGLLNKNLYFALLSGLLLACISLIDDVIDLKPSIRMAAQIITVLIAFIFLEGIQPVPVFGKRYFRLLSFMLLQLWEWSGLLTFLIFLMGLTAMHQLKPYALVLAFYLFTGHNINLILIASVLGFLIWNWPKAKIFMGDVGSTQLGFIIVVLGIYFHNENKLSIIYWLILSAPFWFDATLTLFRRWRNKEKLSQAHRKHIYQSLVQSGFSHLKVDIFLILLNALLTVLVFICIKYNMPQILLLILTLSVMYIIALYADKRKPF